MKKNKKGFFLAETMVVIAVVAVVLLGVFKLFSSVYDRFNETEKYNTVNAINALSNIQMYYENIEEFDVNELNSDTSYIELTNSEKYSSEYYTKLKEELNVSAVYMIDLNKYFNGSTSNIFNASFRRYINTLKNINGVVLVIVLKNNEYANVELSNKFEIKLNGNEYDDYAVYVPVGGEFVDPGYIGWNGDEPLLSWENEVELDTSKEGNYYLHYDFNGYILRRKIVVGDSNGVAYITKLLSQEETLQNGLTQTQLVHNEELITTGIRYVGSNDTVKNKVYFNCEDTYNEIPYGSDGYEYEKACEIWRIIGVFDVEDDTGITEKRIKIVRDAFTTKMSWNSSANNENGGKGINQWGESTYSNGSTYEGADLMKMLNGYYIRESDTCIYCNNTSQETCPTTNNCSSSVAQLSITSLEMVEDALWNTGAVTYNANLLSSSMYFGERSLQSGKICSLGGNCDDTVTRTAKWIGKVGLIYPSDYVYASKDTSCLNDIEGTNSTCHNNNWLHLSSGGYWSLTPTAYSGLASYVWHINATHSVYRGNASDAMFVRPAIYLKSDVEIIGGDGNDKPYILK